MDRDPLTSPGDFPLMMVESHVTFYNYYKTRMCRRNGGKPCPFGKACNFAHSVEELRPFYDLTKTKMCPMQQQHGACSLLDCRYAHEPSELRSTQMLYKTALCIEFMRLGTCKFGSQCRHAHGQEELRCKPPPLLRLQPPIRFPKGQARKQDAGRGQIPLAPEETTTGFSQLETVAPFSATLSEASQRLQEVKPPSIALPPQPLPVAEAASRILKEKETCCSTAPTSCHSTVDYIEQLDVAKALEAAILTLVPNFPPPGFEISRDLRAERLVAFAANSPYCSNLVTPVYSTSLSAEEKEPIKPHSPCGAANKFRHKEQSFSFMRQACHASGLPQTQAGDLEGGGDPTISRIREFWEDLRLEKTNVSEDEKTAFVSELLRMALQQMQTSDEAANGTRHFVKSLVGSPLLSPPPTP